MIIYVDIDNTICSTLDTDYKNATPIKENIGKINDLYKDGNTIVYWTARGSMNPKDWLFKRTYYQLIEWGCMFHELRLGKPSYDLLIDDKAINSLEFFKSGSDV